MKIFRKGHWIIVAGLLVLFSFNALSCSKKSELEEYNRKRERILIEKINKDIKLTFEELISLIGLLASREAYNEIINILENLKNSPKYEEDKYIIYFELAGFYSAIAKQSTKKEKKIRLIERAKKYLDIGFNTSPDKANAYLVRARIYKFMGCRDKSEKDLEKALNIARTRDKILIGGERYLNSEQFIQLAIQSMRWIESDGECILSITNN